MAEVWARLPDGAFPDLERDSTVNVVFVVLVSPSASSFPGVPEGQRKGNNPNGERRPRREEAARGHLLGQRVGLAFLLSFVLHLRPESSHWATGPTSRDHPNFSSKELEK